MKEEKKVELLKAIIGHVDYDTYKYLFETPEEPDLAEEQINELIAIVNEFVEWQIG